jgi:hypothetical protein
MPFLPSATRWSAVKMPGSSWLNTAFSQGNLLSLRPSVLLEHRLMA